MLVLTRRPDESIIIAGKIKITVVSVGPGRVKLGIEAPSDVRIDREEVHEKIEAQTDVLTAVASSAATRDPHTNTFVASGADTATIVPATGTESAPAPAPAAPPLPLHSISKYRLPRKPR
ncbi:MAG: carbon storage regulator [Planctomycetes bacterium]|nr:carbon storage regulator [Planctomycetota bacterium]